MPILSNARHERFAQGVAMGKSQHDAYIYAGYGRGSDAKDVRSNAGKVARYPQVAERIAELQSRQAERIGITVDELVLELNGMLALAKKTKQPSAGVGAILAKAKLLGLIVDKAEMEATVRKPAREPTDKQQMTMDEWKAKFAPRLPGEPLN